MAKQTGQGKRKGSKFEREICKQLSLWWTDGEREDVFWRTASSGGRAVQRSKKGKGTAGGSGDICAIDPIGKPLTDVFTMELKTGYGPTSILDLVDSPASHHRKHPPLWEQWISQAVAAQKSSKKIAWMLITRRHGRMLMVTVPLFVYTSLTNEGARLDLAKPLLKLRPVVMSGVKRVRRTIVCTTWEQFFDAVKPEHIRAM